MSAPNDCWLPSPDEPLFVLVMDHHASFAKDIFGIAGTPTQADLWSMREAKNLVYEGLRQAAGKAPFGREGVLVDEALGAQVVSAAKSDGVVVLMPLEMNGPRVFESAYGHRFAEQVEAFDPDFFKTLVTYNPVDDDGTRGTQITRLAMVSEWAGRTKRRWIIELLVPPTRGQLASEPGRESFDRHLRPGLTAQAILQLQAGGVHPTIWNLEGFDTPTGADEVVAAAGVERGHPARYMVGGDARGDRAQRWLTIAAERQFVGFAVGRSTWEQPLRQSLAGTLSNEGVIDAVAGAYIGFVDAFLHGSGLSRSAPR
jgi:myo-inositol catabolism protein IolC